KAHDLVARHIGLCQRLFDLEGKAADLASGFTVAERGTARVFLEQFGKARAHAVGRVSSELGQQETDFRLQLRALEDRIAQEQTKPSDQRDQEKVGQLLDMQK